MHAPLKLSTQPGSGCFHALLTMDGRRMHTGSPSPDAPIIGDAITRARTLSGDDVLGQALGQRVRVGPHTQQMRRYGVGHLRWKLAVKGVK